jgi:hypothetical protein
MERPRVTKYVRISVTAVSLTVCVLLVALWVRSYWKLDVVPVWNGIAVVSVAGAVGIESNQNHVERLTHSTADFIAEVKSEWPSRLWGTFRASISPPYKYFVIPYWFATLLTAALAVLSSGIYYRRRFSLRTLLIATTLVAVGLGMVVYLAR